MKDISLIIPLYNAEQTIEQCVESAINQTFNNYELLLLDDGSSDNTLEICKAYSEKYSFIRCFRHDNHGVSYTRNRGIRESSGKYIMFADGDDYLLPDMMEQYYQVATATDSEIVIGGIIFVKKGEKNVKLPPNELYTSDTPIDYMAQGFRGIFGYVPNKMYLRSFIIDNAIEFPEDYTAQEDLLFALSAYDHCHSVHQIQYAGYVYIMPEKEKAISREALLNNKLKLGNIAVRRGIDITFLITQINKLLFAELYHANSIEDIKNYINGKDILKWIDYKLCTDKEQRLIIKLAMEHKYRRIFYYFKVRRKAKSLLRGHLK